MAEPSCIEIAQDERAAAVIKTSGESGIPQGYTLNCQCPLGDAAITDGI